jgi:hypothetical protein
MKLPKGGNGSSKFEVGTHDMGGWTRTKADYSGPTPADLAVYLSHHMTAWFRGKPHLKIRCVVPIRRDGETVELHGWYDQIHFPDISPLAPPKE